MLLMIHNLIYIFIFTCYFLALIMIKIKKEVKSLELSSEHSLGIIKHPKAYMKVGIIAPVVFLIGYILAWITDPEQFNEESAPYLIAMSSVFITITFGCIWLMFLAKNWKVIVFDDKFVFINTFGKKKEYKFSEVIRKNTRLGYKIYKVNIKKRIVTISSWEENYDLLMKSLNKYNRLSKKS